MKILNQQVHDDLVAGKPLHLDLGSGGPGRDGCYGVDFFELPGVAIQADLNAPLSALPANSVGRVRSSHCLEHISQFMQLMDELHRIVRPDGSIEITVPHFSNPYGYSDPTHVRFFGLFSFNYFVETMKQPARKVPNFYSDTRFDITRIEISLMKRTWAHKLMYPRMRKELNDSFENQERWERSMCWSSPANEISFTMRPVKGPLGAAR